nr:hypothetical protein GCM10020185_34670 [Pseudomonas brassicacearum subsp. brassicacearum]
MPPQFMAEGSDKVTINGQPAVRSGDRSTCDATVVSAGLISPDVTIGGGSVVVREIRSGKTPGVGLAVTALLMLKGGKGKFFSANCRACWWAARCPWPSAARRTRPPTPPWVRRTRCMPLPGPRC